MRVTAGERAARGPRGPRPGGALGPGGLVGAGGGGRRRLVGDGGGDQVEGELQLDVGGGGGAGVLVGLRGEGGLDQGRPQHMVSGGETRRLVQSRSDSIVLGGLEEEREKKGLLLWAHCVFAVGGTQDSEHALMVARCGGWVRTRPRRGCEQV